MVHAMPIFMLSPLPTFSDLVHVVTTLAYGLCYVGAVLASLVRSRQTGHELGLSHLGSAMLAGFIGALVSFAILFLVSHG